MHFRRLDFAGYIASIGLAAGMWAGIGVRCATGADTRAAGPAAPQPAPAGVRVDRHVVRLPVVEGNDIRFTRISRTQGLSQTRVTHIVQDNQGFMWFGTQYGLNRYDGYKFEVYKHEAGNPNSLSGVYISSLFRDRSGVLWIGCANTLDRFDPVTDTFSHYRIDTRDPSGVPVTVTHISQDSAGLLWLATGNGVYRMDPATGGITRFSHDPSDPRTLSSNDIRYTGEDRSGTLWVAGAEGLDALDPGTGTVSVHVPLHESRDVSFYEDRSGVFWITYASGNGLAVFDRATKRLTKYSFAALDLPGEPLTGVIGLVEDRDGTLWLGTLSDGILKLDRDRRRFVRYRNLPGDMESLSEDRVTTLYEDKEGNIWVGLGATEPNLFATRPPAFTSLPYEAGDRHNLGETLVNALFEDRDGALWIGRTGELSRLNRRTGRYRHFQIPGRGVASDVLAINQDASGSLWLGTSGQGIFRIDPATGRILASYRHRADDASSLSNDIVDRILISRSGILWATTEDGLDRLDATTGRFTTYRRASQGGASYLTITEDAAGILWLGGRTSGLIRFEPDTQKFDVYKHDPNVTGTLSDNRLNAVHVTASGIVWAGTQNGLNRLDPATGAITAYYEKDGLPSSAISCILEDGRGDLWISTNQGVSRFDVRRSVFKNYVVTDGLPGADLTGWGACHRNSTGEMFFGGFAGGTFFRPEAVFDDTYVPPVVLTGFELSGTPVRRGPGSPLSRAISDTERVTLAHDQNDFTLEFSALSFRNPATNRYRYRLDGLDPDWHVVQSDRRLASYTTLPSGAYRFRVQGATGRGPWSEPGKSLTITILPPWWATWWFRSMVAALLAVAVVAAYYYRVRQIRRQFEIRVDERISERTRIARELHDSLLQGFQGLMFRLQAVRNLLPGRPDDAVQALEIALDRGDQAIAEGREAVQDLRSSTPAGADLVQALTVLGAELAAGRGTGEAPSCRVLVEGKARALDPLVRDEIYRVAREGYYNAFRHAQPRRIEAEVAYGARFFSLRIRDDGVGIDPQVLAAGRREGHWGIPGMRERAETFGGQLEIWSEQGVGTEVELKIPAAIAYGNARSQGGSPA